MKTQSSQSRHFLVELIVNCLFFFIMAAVCISIFANGHIISNESNMLSMAVLSAQNAAESFKASEGNAEDLAQMLEINSSENLTVHYDENWLETDIQNAVYSTVIVINPSQNNMQSANICVKNGDVIIYEIGVMRFLENAKGGVT